MNLSEETIHNKQKKSNYLNQLVFNTSIWAFLGHGWSQILRFVGNLILTRILVPADFGVMQLVFVFIQGITMISDLGINVNIIQSHRGEDVKFLRSAWTIQFLRGVCIEIILLIIAGPVAYIYQVPILQWLIPIAGLNAIIDGLSSTNLAVQSRKMTIGKVTLLDMFAQITGMIAMITCAYYWQNVWALLVFGFVSSTIKTIFSFLLFSGPKMRFEWHYSELSEIVNFGQWVFLSSIAGFLLTRADRLILGLYLSLSNLGVYGIAYALAMAMSELQQAFSQKMLIPLYSHLCRNSDENIRQHIFKIRLILIATALPFLFYLIIYGQSLINFLYPSDYHEAGWMIKILAISASIKCLQASMGPILFAVGNSFRMMILMLASSTVSLLALFIGGTFFGTKGIIWAIPASDLLIYPILVATIYKYNVWFPWFDLIVFILIFLVSLIGGVI